MDLKAVGEIIKERRKVLALSQLDFCEIANVSQHTLSAIENGTANPEVATLIKIFDKLGIEMKLKVRRFP
ncbi:MAG: helix-turn-helix domain-containing protein [bacterium]